MSQSHPNVWPDLVPNLARQRKIGVFRALQLGDMLCAVPALRALRAAAPKAHITLIGLPWAASFARRFAKYVDAHIAFPGFPGLPGQPAKIEQIPGFIASVQKQNFDCMVQMHGSGKITNPLIMTFGARRNAGFYPEGEYCPDPLHFLKWEDRQHETVRHIQLMEFLGAPSQGEELEFPLTAQDVRLLLETSPALPAPGSYACIHAGARLASRRWPASCFAEVAQGLHDAGLQIVLAGAAQEVPLSLAIQSSMHAPVLNLTGKTDLGTFAALVSQARIVVCNDTGVSQIAAAVKTPSVVICTGADPKCWAPLNGRRHRMVYAGTKCRLCEPSDHLDCPHAHRCAPQLSSRTVLDAIFEVLDDNPVVKSVVRRMEKQVGA